MKVLNWFRYVLAWLVWFGDVAGQLLENFKGKNAPKKEDYFPKEPKPMDVVRDNDINDTVSGMASAKDIATHESDTIAS